MGTSYSNIFERFSMKVQDYNLDKLFLSSVSNWENYILGFLKSAIPRFSKCQQDLTDRTDSSKTFNITLSEIEEEILSLLMVAEWMEKEVRDIKNIRLALNDTGAMKRYSEAQNLREKENSLSNLRERADKLIVEYSFNEYDFTTLY